MSAPLKVAKLRARIADLEAELAVQQQLNSDLRDSLESCRANVIAQQDEHAAYRLHHPPRREAP
ncbi:hypothetical protein ACIP69_18060 [Streptomyces hygroscopicus]|uniref:hypothetical protein n=1 Tax=Streptomyces hygroscopicus TaxID=1912 RepID=UPI00380010C3